MEGTEGEEGFQKECGWGLSGEQELHPGRTRAAGVGNMGAHGAAETPGGHRSVHKEVTEGQESGRCPWSGRTSGH